jgi:energy-coupling factor transporter ATP-binding protein EcfA2
MKILLIGPPSSGKSAIVAVGYAALRRRSAAPRLKARFADRFRLWRIAGAASTPATRYRRQYTLRYVGAASTEDIYITDYPGAAVRAADRAVIRTLLDDLDEADVVIGTRSNGDADPWGPGGWAAWGPALRASLARRASPPALLLVRTQLSQGDQLPTQPPLPGEVATMQGMTAAAVSIRRDQGSVPLLWALANGGPFVSRQLANAARKALESARTADGAPPITPLSQAFSGSQSGPPSREAPLLAEKITVTMLGTSGSGKTTFMIAMVGVLAVGTAKYALATAGDDEAKGHDDQKDLLDQWDDLRMRGMLPLPNDENPRSYRLVFWEDLNPLLNIDWIDYRGRVLEGRTDAPDVADMVNRAAASDCIFLVIDAQFLVNGVSEMNRRSIERETKPDHMSTIVLRAIQQRQEKGLSTTSLVVLVTKADLLNPGGQATREQRQRIQQKLIEDVRTLLPIAFRRGVNSLVALVSVGRFGAAAQGSVDPDQVSPIGLHQPLLFAVIARYWQQQERYRRLAGEAQAAGEGARQQQSELREKKRGWISGPRTHIQIRNLDREADKAARDAERYRAQEELYEKEAAKFAAELIGLQIFRDGSRVD